MKIKSFVVGLALSLLPSIAAAEFLGESWCPEEVVYFSAQFNDQAGSAVTASSVTWRCYEQGSGTAVANGSMSAVDAGNALGLFEGSVTLAAASGFEVGKVYTIRMTGDADAQTPASTHYLRIGCLATVTEAGIAQGGAGSTITLRSGASGTTDFYVGQSVELYANTGVGQSRTVTAYNSGTKIATLDHAWAVNPDNTSRYRIRIVQSPKIDSSLQIVVGAMADNSVTPQAMAPNCIGESELADGAITGPTLANNAITNEAIEDDAIDNSKVADGTIDAGKFATNAISSAAFSQGAADKCWLTTDRTVSAGDNITSTGDPILLDVNGKVALSGSAINSIYNQDLSVYTAGNTAGLILRSLQP